MLAPRQTRGDLMPDIETSVHRFPQRMALRVPAGLPRAVEAAARLQFTSPSEWARRALLHALQADGVCLGADGRVTSGPARRSHHSAPASMEARP